MKSLKNKIIIGILILLVLLFAIRIFYYEKSIRARVTEAAPPVNTFAGVELEAKSAYVLDLKKGQVLYSKDANTQLPLASITKVMSAIVAMESSKPDLVVTTHEKLLPERGGGDIYANESFRLRDILDFALVASSNDAAEAVATAVGALDNSSDPELSFVDKMNEKAKSMGLNQTFFVNPSGLDVSTEYSGAYGSAKDVASLISYAYIHYPELMSVTAEPNLYLRSLSGIEHNVKNTNTIADELPGLSASKTGFTDLAGGNLAIVAEAGPGRPIAIAVLGSSLNGRFEDVEKLYKATLQYINLNYE